MYRQVGLGWICSADCLSESSRTSPGQLNRTLKPKASSSSTKRSPNRTKKADIPAPVRQAVLERDLARCRWCGALNPHLHHVILRSQGGPHEMSNLIGLCEKHHSQAHTNVNWWSPILRACIWNKSWSVPQAMRMLGWTELLASRTVDSNGCWLGRLEVQVNGHFQPSWDVAFQNTAGPLLGRTVIQMCGHPECWNPAHLKISQQSAV